MKILRSLLLVSLILGTTRAGSRAQVIPPQVDQLRQNDAAQVPSLPPDDSPPDHPMPTFASESPGDDDLGQQVILKSKNVYQPLTVYLGTEVDRLSNVGLSETNEQEDWLWRTSLGASYAPRFGNYLQGNLSISQDVYRYNEFDALNFESLNASLGLAWHLWFFHALNTGVELGYQRLTSDGYGDEIFSNRSLALTLSRNFILSRAHYFYVIGGAEFGWSDPGQAARDEYTLLLGYHLRVARNFFLDAFYRVGLLHYSEIDREDLQHTLQLTARYQLTKWLSLNASLGGSSNDSDRPGFDYETWNTGVGAYVNCKF